MKILRVFIFMVMVFSVVDVSFAQVLIKKKYHPSVSAYAPDPEKAEKAAIKACKNHIAKYESGEYEQEATKVNGIINLANIAHCYGKLNQPEKAIAAYRLAIENKDHFTNDYVRFPTLYVDGLYFGIGKEFVKLGDKRKAMQIYDEMKAYKITGADKLLEEINKMEEVK